MSASAETSDGCVLEAYLRKTGLSAGPPREAEVLSLG